MTRLLSPLALVALTLSLASCDQMSNKAAHDERTEATADTAVVFRDGQTAAGAISEAGDNLDFDTEMPDYAAAMPDVRYEEVSSPDVKIRGNERYHIYSVDETVFFATDKAQLQPSAKDVLTQISKSISQRYGTAQVRVVGHTDSRASEAYNKALGMERATAVKAWLTSTGGIEESRVKALSRGETQPEANNATAAGRQENRRVEIAVLAAAK